MLTTFDTFPWVFTILKVGNLSPGTFIVSKKLSLEISSKHSSLRAHGYELTAAHVILLGNAALAKVGLWMGGEYLYKFPIRPCCKHVFLIYNTY